MKFLLPVLGSLLLPVFAFASDPLVSFGENSPTAGKAALQGPHAGSVRMMETKEGLQISAPNFWSTIVQYLNLEPISLADLKPDDSLTISVKGSPGGSAPKLRVQFVAPANWKQWAIWEFDLTGVTPDKFTTIKAETAFKDPVDKAGEELPASIGSIQIFTKGTDSSPWDLEIQSIAFESK